jgi:hypothetical protein
MDSITLVKSAIADLQTLLKKLEDRVVENPPKVIKKQSKEIVRHTPESFKEYGRKISDDEGWANGCRFPRKSWPLTADGKEYAKLQDLARDLRIDVEKGTLGSEIYLFFD